MHKQYSLPFLVTLLCLLSPVVVHAQGVAEKTILDLDPKIDRTYRWFPRSLGQIRHVRMDDFVSGEAAIKVQFHSTPSSKTSFPGVRFLFKEGPQDWRGFEYFAFDIKNPSPDVVGFCIGINQYEAKPRGDDFLAGCTQVGPRQTLTFLAPLKPKGASELEGRWGTYLLPRKWKDRLNVQNVSSFEIVLMEPKRSRTVFFGKFRLLNGPTFENVSDAYGQNATADWPGKTKSEEGWIAAREREEAALKDPDRSLDAYGGQITDPPQKVTGHFRVQKVNDRHYFITPAGGLFFSLGLNSVNTRMDTKVTGRENLFQAIPFKTEKKGEQITDLYESNLNKVYSYQSTKKVPVTPQWKNRALKRLRSWGFNTLGAWSDEGFIALEQIPYTILIPAFQAPHKYRSFRAGSVDYPDFFDRSFRSKLLDKGGIFDSDAMRAHNESAWCLGLFVDNEIHWTGDEPADHHLVVRSVFELDASFAVKKAFVRYVQKKYGSVPAWRDAWGIAISQNSFDEIIREKIVFPQELGLAAQRGMDELLGLFAGEYYRLVREATQKYLPNILYLGSRFDRRGTPPVVIEAATPYVDVLSFNAYLDELAPESFEAAIRSDKPFLVSEYNFNALDRGAPQGHVQVVATQAERAGSYVRYGESALKIPQCVGLHWFKYKDQPVTGRTGSGENYNCGFITVTDLPYEELVDKASAWNRNIYKRIR